MKYLLTSILIIVYISCSKEIVIENNSSPSELYNEFWTLIDQNYIFFDEKNVDWDSVYTIYSSQINESTTERKLLDLMELSLNSLRDTHNELRSNLRPIQKYNYREEAPHFFSLEMVQKNYFSEELLHDGSLSYGMINDSSFYVHAAKMENILKLQKLLQSQFNTSTKNIVIDLRNNSGGETEDIIELLGDYVSEKTYLGAFIEKTGPERNDESIPLPVYTEPNSEFNFNDNVYILINHVSYSATSYFAAMAKDLENFTLVGQKTGGGGGGVAGFELSNGWQLLISVSDLIDKKGRSAEYGVIPDVIISNEHFIGEQDSDVVFEKLLKVMK